VKVAYRGVPVDDEGLPMIPDDGVFLETLE
jgi:hypothetical protein